MKNHTNTRGNGRGSLYIVSGETMDTPQATQATASPVKDIISRGEALLRLPEVLSLAGISRSEVYRRIREGGFPKPVKVGSKANAWPLSEVQAWVAARIAARDAKEVQA